MHKHHFQELYECLSHSDNKQCRERLENINCDKYLARKNEICKALTGSETANLQVVRPVDLYKGVSTPYDIPVRVKEIYKQANAPMKALARDVFIVRSNIEKEEWMLDISLFKEYVSCIMYIHRSNMMRFADPKINSRAYIATIWNTLLKSDVLLYVPQAIFMSPPSGYVDYMPQPVQTTRFSLNVIQEKYREYAGGSYDSAIQALSKIESLM
jgi:hypothetical protein